jgi:hypothetical protein
MHRWSRVADLSIGSFGGCCRHSSNEKLNVRFRPQRLFARQNRATAASLEQSVICQPGLLHWALSVAQTRMSSDQYDQLRPSGGQSGAPQHCRPSRPIGRLYFAAPDETGVVPALIAGEKPNRYQSSLGLQVKRPYSLDLTRTASGQLGSSPYRLAGITQCNDALVNGGVRNASEIFTG